MENKDASENPEEEGISEEEEEKNNDENNNKDSSLEKEENQKEEKGPIKKKEKKDEEDKESLEEQQIKEGEEEKLEEESEAQEEVYEKEYEKEGNLIKLFYPDIDSPVEFYKFYEMTQFGSEIVEDFEVYRDYTNYQDYNNIYRGIIKKIEPGTGKSIYEFIFLIDLDYYGNDPFLVPYSYSILSYFTAEFKSHVINFEPSDKAWVYAVFVSEKLGIIMKTSLKLLFYLSKDNIDVNDLQIHPHSTFMDIINFLKIWDDASNQAEAINLNDHYIRRIKLSILLTRDNILKFLSQFPGYLSDHICELFVVRAYDPENYERLIDSGNLKKIFDKFDPGVFNQIVPAILKPENLSLWLNESSKEFMTDFFELLKLKEGIESKTPSNVCKECMKLRQEKEEKKEAETKNNENKESENNNEDKESEPNSNENNESDELEDQNSENQKSKSEESEIKKPNCDKCKYKAVYFPIHIWNKVNDIYLKWNKTDINGVNRNIKWSQYLNETVYIDKLHYEKSNRYDKNSMENARALKSPRTWGQVDKYGFRPDFRLYNSPRIDQKINPFEGRLFFGADEKTCGNEFLPKKDNYDLQKFVTFYFNIFEIELKILPPFQYPSALFYYIKDDKRHFVILSDKTIWRTFEQLGSRAIKMLYFNNDMSNIELFFYDFHTITKIELDVFMEKRTEVIKFHSVIGQLIDVVLDMQNRGWNFDLLFEEPFIPISIYYNFTVEHTWYKDPNTYEFVDPFTSAELEKIKELDRYAPYIRSIKLFSIQKNNPEFYNKMVKWFPAEDESDEEPESNEMPPDYEKSIEEIVEDWAYAYPTEIVDPNDYIDEDDIEDEDEDEDED